MSLKTIPVVTFSNPHQDSGWRAINDVVMGGRSNSRMVITENQTAIFEGYVSLENYGGFASVRSAPKEYNLKAFDGLQIRVCGDGHIYQMRLLSSQNYSGIHHVTDFNTVAGEWQEIQLPFRSFHASFRGMPVPLAPRLKTEHIYTFGFLIARKQAGNFRLEIESILAYQALH